MIEKNFNRIYEELSDIGDEPTLAGDIKQFGIEYITDEMQQCPPGLKELVPVDDVDMVMNVGIEAKYPRHYNKYPEEYWIDAYIGFDPDLYDVHFDEDGDLESYDIDSTLRFAVFGRQEGPSENPTGPFRAYTDAELEKFLGVDHAKLLEIKADAIEEATQDYEHQIEHHINKYVDQYIDQHDYD